MNFDCKSQQYNLPVNNELNLRFEKNHFADSNFHFAVKPFFLLDTDTSTLLKTNNLLFNKVLNNNVITLNKDKFNLDINPLIEIISENNIDKKHSFYSYKAGIDLKGKFSNKLYFNISGFYGISEKNNENKYINDSIKIIPHFGEILSETANNYSFYSIFGYFAYQPNKYLNLQIGKDKDFWGEGYRSLFLSDNSNSYPFFKATVDIWKFKYIWLISALKDNNLENTSFTLNRKFSFSHFLSWNATNWLNINFFEAIISNPIDSAGVNYFNINYLNPVIFLRPVEFAGGSADNAIIGIGTKLKIFKKYQIYSQLVFDEFVFSEIKSNKGWWGNKYAFQIGFKSFNLFKIKNLISIFEYNYIRPYTYSYINSIQNYGNYYQPLAHPAGANLKETVFIAHYHYKRFSTQIKAIYSVSGADIDTVSYGGDIYKSYEKRKDDYGNYITQGIVTEYINIEISNNWIINPKYNLSFFIDFSSAFITNVNLNFKRTTLSFGIKSLLFNNNKDYLN